MNSDSEGFSNLKIYFYNQDTQLVVLGTIGVLDLLVLCCDNIVLKTKRILV